MDCSISREDCLWEKLAATDRPIVLYGTGNGADKAIDALETIGRKPSGVFASDDFVRKRTYRGMPVLSCADAAVQFGCDMVVLVVFGSSRPDVMANIRTIDETYETYMPDLPLFGGELFTFDYFRLHREKIENAYQLMADNVSRALFCDILNYRLQGTLRYLGRTESWETSLATLLNTDRIRAAMDGGAFTGDTAKIMRSVFPNIQKILAAEPDARTFRKLSDYAETSRGVVHPLPYALWDCDTTLCFSSAGSRGSGGSSRRAKTTQIAARTVDSLVSDIHLDFLKLDVEGDEGRAITGAEKTILRDIPALGISLYHRSADLFEIPNRIAREFPWYSLYLRRVPCYPAWDLMLYAVPEQFAKH